MGQAGYFPCSGNAPILGQGQPRQPASRKAVCAFHRQLPLFGDEMSGMQTKYNILWFIVDLYHRQRYFFICGCKQIVTCSGVKTRRLAAGRTVLALISSPRPPVFARDFQLQASRLPCAG
jgi:hypothetical protein